MNQSILFPDMQRYDESLQAVSFTAQQGGALITCFVGVGWLSDKTGRPLGNEQDILSVFGQYRFDLEEAAEAAIEEEEFDEAGDIWLSD